MATEPIRLKIKSAEARIEDVHLRMPFKFGIATLTDVPKFTVRVVAEDAKGKSIIGYSSDMLPALWFDKAPEKTIDQKVEDQITMAQIAMDQYLKLGASPMTPFELWWAAYPVIKKMAADRGINALTAGFGSSFAERATIDAACRLAGVPFFNAVQDNLLGIQGHLVHHELAGFDLKSALPPKPLAQVWCRHTVGLGDPLHVADIKPEDRVNDGLPQALEEDIDTYGLRYFKVKIDGDRERNLSRLSGMAEVIGAKCPKGYVVTLDGNEQVKSLDDVEWLFDGLKKS
ncbi:mandelate racemase, partial [Candidatus Sumerlaeota bacterium]|nr:mandelate racemase [Candidatus Sumerlaeota bacterium]